MSAGKELVKRIDAAVAEKFNKPKKGRRHLGGSVIGKDCARQIWYGWRWFHITKHGGRLHRLWQRGHEEEFRFVEYLRLAGYEVRDYTKRLMYHDASDAYITIDWDDTTESTWAECIDVSEDRVHIERCQSREEQLPKDERMLQQWGFKAHRDHFAGNDDGRVRGPDLPEGWGLLECKTYNDKRFKILAAKGVLSSDLGYYNQMQTYMKQHNLKWALFIAVNKNDDELHAEVVYYREEIAEAYYDRAEKLIECREAPARISNDPSWFKCKMCDYREICHKGAAPMKNCRTCVFSQATDGGRFYCNQFMNVIPEEFEPLGCNEWTPFQ